MQKMILLNILNWEISGNAANFQNSNPFAVAIYVLFVIPLQIMLKQMPYQMARFLCVWIISM